MYRSLSSKVRRACSLLVCSSLLSTTLATRAVLADDLTSVTDTLSSTSSYTGVSHTISFHVTTTGTIGTIKVRFATFNLGITKPADMDLSTATIGATTGLGGGTWTIDTSSASSGLLGVSSATPAITTAGDAITIRLDGIVNPKIGNCITPITELRDTCWMQTSTYSDSAGTIGVDTGTTSFIITEDPRFSLEVSGVAAGQAHNGITTTLASTSTAIPFGTIGVGTVHYIAHKLTLSSNAPHGYTVYAYLSNDVRGLYNNSNYIAPFAATDATWSTPQAWSTPTGNSASPADRAWIGANSTDSRLTGLLGSGWNSPVGKFGPISAIRHAVAYSSGQDLAGSEIYVTYAVETNDLEPADTYQGMIVYDVEAHY